MPDIDIGNLPNFFIIGAAKAGTTTLFDLLKQHPQIYLPFNKEPMYFSHDDNYKRGVDWYKRTYFHQAAHSPARGEATPHYLYWSEKVAPRINQLYSPRPVKYIVMLRDPVSRAYSWYWNMVKEGRETLPFKEALEEENRRLDENWESFQYSGSMTYGYTRGSRYAAALAPYLTLFPRQDFHFILQEDLETAFTRTIKNLLEFLALDVAVTIDPVTSNQATAPRSKRFQTWLRQQSKPREFLLSFFPLRIRYAVKTRLLQSNARLARYPSLDSDLEKDLRTRFVPDIENLAKIIERDLSNWLPK
jgi:hypothetical protein